jgi:hypothetical protein
MPDIVQGAEYTTVDKISSFIEFGSLGKYRQLTNAWIRNSDLKVLRSKEMEGANWVFLENVCQQLIGHTKVHLEV